MMDRRLLDLWVGIFVVAGIGALFVLALQVSNASSFNTAESYTVVAEFDNIGGLKPRAPVRSAGVTVGRVKSISLDAKSYQGVVRMEIDNHVKFPKDTSAKILTAGLLGDQYVGLEPGGDEKDLAPGDVIRQTQSAVVLENLIGQLIFNKAADAGTAAPADAAPKK